MTTGTWNEEMLKFTKGQTQGEGFQSSNNTSTASLTAGSTYTGTGELTRLSDVGVSCKTDQDGTLFFDFSNDGTNWDTFPPAGFKVVANIHEFHTAVKLARYFRVRFTNTSASDQTFFRLYTYYGNFRQPNAPANFAISRDSDSTLVRTADSFLDISLGLISEYTNKRKFGANQAVGTTEEDIWQGGGSYNWLTSAATLRIAAGGDANDTAAGSGARSVVLEYLDENFVQQSETLITNGASASTATTGTAIRLNRAYVEDVGTYTGNNTGGITIETSGGTTVAFIEAAKGQTQLALYTVPANMTAYVYKWTADVDSNKTADIFFWQRKNADDVSAPFTGKRLVSRFQELSGNDTRELPFEAFPEKTDVWIAAESASGTSAVYSEFHYVEVNN